MPTITTRFLTHVAVPTLHLAFDLGNRRWDLAFTTSAGEPPRRRVCSARDLTTLDREIARAKEHFGLPPNVPVVSCYEARRDGFWLQRALAARDITNTILDSASIEVNRRRRRDKSDSPPAEAGSAASASWRSPGNCSWPSGAISKPGTYPPVPISSPAR